MLDDGDTKANVPGTRIERTKGAYYKNIERKMTLKKRRTNVRCHTPSMDYCYCALTLIAKIQETYVDKWQVVHISHLPMSKEELDEREELMAEVVDPMYLRVDADADGEGDIDLEVVGQMSGSGGISSAGGREAYETGEDGKDIF